MGVTRRPPRAVAPAARTHHPQRRPRLAREDHLRPVGSGGDPKHQIPRGLPKLRHFPQFAAAPCLHDSRRRVQLRCRDAREWRHVLRPTRRTSHSTPPHTHAVNAHQRLKVGHHRLGPCFVEHPRACSTQTKFDNHSLIAVGVAHTRTSKTRLLCTSRAHNRRCVMCHSSSLPSGHFLIDARRRRAPLPRPRHRRHRVHSRRCLI